MTRRQLALLAASCLTWSACADPAPSAGEEVAAELRALRLQLAAAARQQATAPAPAQPVTIAAKELLAPLQPVLDGLVQAQAELAARQVTMTQELQRWSQLLVETVAGSHGDEVKALTQRLAQLEAALTQQDARHRQVETMLQGALERTADRLDDFLRRLHGGTTNGSTTNGAPPAPATSPPANGANGASGAGSNGDHREREEQVGGNGGEVGENATTAALPVPSRPMRASTRWWWLGLTATACALAGFFLRRAWRLAPVRADLDSTGPKSLAAPREQTAEELWAAAELLGQAVDRLRQSVSVPGAPTASEARPHDAPAPPVGHAPDDAIDLDDVLLLEDDELQGLTDLPVPAAGAATPTAPMPAVPAPVPARTPPGLVDCTLPPGASLAAALTFLAHEPVVLRKPAPVPSPLAGGATRLSFALIPGLSAGERARLLLALRAAAGGR